MTETAKETLQRVRNRRAAFAKKKAEALRPEVLEAIKELNKSQPDDAKTRDLIQKRSIAETSYWDLVTTIKSSRGISLLDAMRAAEKETDPAELAEAKERWLDDVNSERRAAGAPRSVAKADGKNFPEMVSYLRLHHKMSVSEAHRHIDRQWPGLRVAWVDKKNREGK